MNNKGLRSQNDGSTWMVAYITYDLMEAHIIVGRLQHEGIMAIVDHLVGRAAFGITLGMWGEVRVLVHPADFEDSQIILFPEGPELLDDPNETDTIYLNMDEEDDDE